MSTQKYINWFLLTLLSFNFLIACSVLPELPAGTRDLRSQRITTYLNELLRDDHFPGIQYMIVNQNDVLYEYAGGQAVLGNATMTLRSPMMLYSASKVITAAAILRLVDQGKLQLDDKLSDHLPDIPYKDITIRQVLTHSSGIPNPVIGNMYVHPESQSGIIDTKSMLADVLKDKPDLEFTPGSEFSYSNLGFVLLGELIAKLSKQSYPNFIRNEVFAPLGIHNKDISFSFDSFATDSRGYVNRSSMMNLAMGIMLDDFTPEYYGKWKTFQEHWYFNFPAHGGLIANAPGVAKFLQDQLRPASYLLSTNSKEEFFRIQKPAVSSRIKSTDISLAWFYNKDAKEPYYFHEGSAFGYITELRIYPAKGIASILLINATQIPHKQMMDQFDNEFL